MRNLKFIFILTLVCLINLTLNAQTHFDDNITGLKPWNQHFTISASSPTSSPGPYIHMYGSDHQTNPLPPAQPSFQYRGDIVVMTRGANGDFRVGNNTGSQWREHLTVKQNGKVTIGHKISDPSDGYLLAVDQGIQTQQIKVCPSTNGWCDYVFEPDYERNSIEEVDNYVRKNKHLPNVPSAQEVEEEGINVAEMDATLLRQIEELWLHMIDLNKKVDSLEKENKKLKTQLEVKDTNK